MLKEAIEKIQQLSQNTIVGIGDEHYLLHDGSYTQIRPELDFEGVKELTSLEAVVCMMQRELSDKKAPVPLFVEVKSHDEVTVFSEPIEELREMRLHPYIATATDVPGWAAEVNMGFDEAMIALRTRFQETPDIEYALKLLNDLTTGSKVTFNDNGVATSVVTKTGVALQSNQTIRPIITLKPYRTFQEVEQPASEFCIRVSERGIRFIEADGGMWKLKARQNVKAWLEERLADEIKNKLVVVML
jgi:hypothetical protein